MVGSNKGFRVFANIILVILSVCCILPFVLLVSSSITDEAEIMKNGYSFIPKVINFKAYQYLFQSVGGIVKAYGMTLLVTLIGTSINVSMTCLLYTSDAAENSRV